MKKGRTGFTIFLILMLLSGMVSGCGSGNGANEASTGENQTPASQSPAASEKRTLLIGANADIMTTDPQAKNSGPTTAVLYNVFSHLIKQADDTSLVKDAAADYRMIDDTTWEFTLRDDIYFHNGDKLTAQDVKFSLDRVSTDETLVEYTHFSPIDQVIVVDDTHLQIKTDEPYPTLPNLLAKSGGEILPQAYIEAHDMDYFMANPVGSGPYKLISYIKDDRVVLVPSDRYYETINPDWDEVIFRVIPESSTRIGELLAGNVDVVNVVIPAEWDRVNSNSGTSIINGPSTRVYQLALKVDGNRPTADLRVRQAIDLAINDQLIVDQILKGAGAVTLTRVPAGVSGHDPSLYGKYNYDPEKAKQLLADAGYADGFTLKIQAPTGRYTMDTEIAQAIAAMLESVGIKVDLELLESSAYSNVYGSYTSEDGFLTCFGLGFIDAAYAMIGYTLGYTTGESNYTDEYFNELFFKAQSNMDLEEREKQFFETQQIIARDMPYIVMCQIDNSFGVSDAISFPARLDDVWNLQTIRKK
jgi:peptide/nickel transport system substrate-binding protein